MTLSQIQVEYRLTCDGDAWGNAMNWLFAIADEIHFNRSVECPASWQFKPSILGASNDPDDYATGIVRDAPDHDLITFGQLLNRYLRALRHAGHDY